MMKENVLELKCRTDLLLKKKQGSEGRRNKKNGEMPRSEESWLFVKGSGKKAFTGPN